MAALKEPVKIYIVQALACMDTPQQVADAVKLEYGLEIDRRQCALYDPTKRSGKNLSKKLKVLFYRTRADFKGNILDIPIANKSFRLRELQRMYEGWGKNKIMRQGILKQARDETQGHDIQILDMELKRLEIQKQRDGEGGVGDEPTPVTINVNVVDARVNHDDQSDA
jgi:hypothetical protein